MAELENKLYSFISPEDITFEFEEFLEEHEENLPDGLDAEYMTYVPILESPFKNIRKLRNALLHLPINAILHQNWSTIFSLLLVTILLSIPSFGYLLYVSAIVNNLGIGISFTVIILLGILAAFLYLKSMYATLSSLVESRKAPWLVEKIRKEFITNYQKDWSRSLLLFSTIVTFVFDISLFFVALAEKNYQVTVIWIIVSVIIILIGHIGISLMIFVSILSFQYIQVNTGIYDQVLQTIIDRVKGYTEGHESILNKKNYEVVGVLSDTPGLSIRSLGDIPVFGLGSGIFSVNSLIFILLSPFMLWTPGTIILQTLGGGGTDPTIWIPQGLSRVILLGIALASIASFFTIIGPVWRITNVMANFKNKALTELDPYLFDEITGVALRKDTEISNETQVLFMIRSYIHSMKTSPVSPFRLAQMVVLAILYGSRLLPLVFQLILGG